mmetsp:Transcript_3736/g.11585  ORF Transcript_3736/g.11585 Transcript_3736/m.11585 type:complete len:509 (+) Transcript_3736:463-1989(+)
MSAYERRPSMVEILAGGAAGASGVSAKALRDLAWRQKYAGAEEYVLALDDREGAAPLRLAQTKRGELEGLGTGGTVWPAAHVLARFLAKEKRGYPPGWSALEIGCGTAAAGLAAAALGARRVALTDLGGPVLEVARRNLDANKASVARSAVEVHALDWAAPRDSAAFSMLRPTEEHFDVVLASECVLPKLYPLEPLVACLGAVIGPETVAYVAVELRTWHAFDPKARFFELCRDAGLGCETVPRDALDPDFVADDLEIWQVARSRKSPSPPPFVVERWGAGSAKVRARGVALELAEGDGVGAVAWPSAVAFCRAVLDGAFWPRLGRGARVLELGAGTGLASCFLAKVRGCAVVATDLDRHVERLRGNLEKNGALSDVPSPGSAVVRAVDWAAPLPAELLALGPFDAVVLADCAYDSRAVEPLAKTVAALWYAAHPPAALLVANEHRTALDAFLRALGKFEWAPLLTPCIDAASDLERLDCLGPDRQPPPIALFQSAPPPGDDESTETG